MDIKDLRQYLSIFLLLLLSVAFIGPPSTLAQQPGQIKSYYSPIIRIEPQKGFLLITADSGILWVQVEENAKAHLNQLGVGDMIDLTVQYRPDNLPPILKAWKLARSESPCKIFDGTNCKKE